MNKVVAVPVLGFLSLSLLACSSVSDETVGLPAEPGELELRAVGNEPFWSLQVFAEQVNLQRLGADTEFFAITSKTQTDDSQRVRFTNHAFSGSALVRNELCHDSMTGMPYPYSAQVQIPGETLQGCAGEPLDLLQANPWRFDQLGDHSVADLVVVTMSFEDERVTGSTGCNRYFGGYQLTGEGLRFAETGMTKMACDGPRNEAEQQFTQLLNQVNRFDITPDGVLILHTQDGQTMQAQPHRLEK